MIKIIEKLKNFYNKKKDFVWLVAIMLVLFFVFSGFGSNLSSRVSTLNGGGAYYAADTMEMDYAVPIDAKAEASRGMIAPMPPSYDEAGYFEDVEQRIRKTAYTNIEVDRQDYDSAKSAIDSVISQNKGFYLSKNEYKHTYRDAEYRTYTIQFKVDKDSFEDAVESLKSIGDLKSLNIDSDDLTTQYQDTKAYLESYQKEKARIEELLDQAEEIEDIIRIEERLNQIQRTIDNYQKQLTNIERQTDYSTISVTLNEKQDIPTTIYEMTGIREHIRNVLVSFDNVFVFVSRAFGWAIVALVLYLLYKGYRRVKKR